MRRFNNFEELAPESIFYQDNFQQSNFDQQPQPEFDHQEQAKGYDEIVDDFMAPSRTSALFDDDEHSFASHTQLEDLPPALTMRKLSSDTTDIAASSSVDFNFPLS